MDKTDNVHIIFDESVIKQQVNTIAKITGKINDLPPELADSGCKEALVKTLVNYKTSQMTDWLNGVCKKAFAPPMSEFIVKDSTILLDPLSEEEADYSDYAPLIDPLLDEEGKYRKPNKGEEVAVSVERDGRTIYYKWAGASVLQLSSVNVGHTRLYKHSLLSKEEAKQKAKSKEITAVGKKREPYGSCENSSNKENSWTEDDKTILAEELTAMIDSSKTSADKTANKKKTTKKRSPKKYLK